MTCGLAAAVSTGATLALLPRFDPGGALHMVAAERVTVFEGLPAMYAAMLGPTGTQRLADSSLQVCMSGGAVMPTGVLRRFEDKSNCTVLEGYGMPETSGPACFNHPNSVRKAASVGTPLDGVRMRVVDEHSTEVPTGRPGEIQVRGHNVMKGYWNFPATAADSVADGWFSTGDIGRVDGDGYYFVVVPKNI
jgi:long-chain acyl-CoA synthetase